MNINAADTISAIRSLAKALEIDMYNSDPLHDVGLLILLSKLGITSAHRIIAPLDGIVTQVVRDSLTQE